jgi:hypothetical protein
MLVVHRQELERHAGYRQADDGLAAGIAARRHRHRAALGGADAGDDEHALAEVRHRHLVQPGPGVHRQHRAAVVDELQPREEALAQRTVGAQLRQQRGKAGGRVEVETCRCRRGR